MLPVKQEAVLEMKRFADEEFVNAINPNSLIVLKDCLIEEGIKDAKNPDAFQFMRNGYFCVDKDSTPEKMIFNRTVQKQNFKIQGD